MHYLLFYEVVGDYAERRCPLGPTIMIYTHVLNRSGGRGVRSPLDSL
jgi:hypothetical protein